MSEIEIRHHTDADREATFAVRVQAFRSDRPAYDPAADDHYPPDERRLVADDGGEVVAHLAVWDHAQWFEGRAVPSGGVAGVAVRPSHRRAGVGSALLHRALVEMRERGEHLSSLFPLTYAPYRRHGWEVAGTYLQRTVPVRSLTTLPRPERDHRIELVTVDDVPAMVRVHDHVSHHQPGNLRRGERFTWRMIGPDDEEDDVGYVARRDGEVVGYVWYEHTQTTEVGASYGIRVRELVGIDADAELALWHVVASSSSAAFTATYVSRPDDPLLFWLPEGNDLRAVPAEHQWMTRLVDAPGAVAARGYRSGVAVTVPLHVRDPAVPDNDGAAVLEVRDGEGRLTAGGDGRVQLGIGAFASLYTGWASAWSLAHAGLIDGATEADLRALDAAFAGRMPWVRNYF